MPQEKLLFQDKDVKITDQRVYIKCYYFPIATSKTIRYEDIKKIEVIPLDMGKMRIWGMGVWHWGYWFPGDCSRPHRDQFIAIYIGSCIVPTFTTQNTNIVFNILYSELEKFRNKNQGIHDQINRPQSVQNSLERNILQQ